MDYKAIIEDLRNQKNELCKKVEQIQAGIEAIEAIMGLTVTIPKLPATQDHIQKVRNPLQKPLDAKERQRIYQQRYQEKKRLAKEGTKKKENPDGGLQYTLENKDVNIMYTYLAGWKKSGYLSHEQEYKFLHWEGRKPDFFGLKEREDLREVFMAVRPQVMEKANLSNVRDTKQDRLEEE